MEAGRRGDKKTNAPETAPAVSGQFDSTVTLLFSDIRGFTEYTNQHGDETAFKVLQEHNAIVRKQIETFGGKVVKTQGDSFMVAFTTAKGAIICAVAIQLALGKANRNQTGTRIAIGIGINTGEPIQEGGDFFGGTVNLAARICAAAGPGEIFIAETTRYVAGRIESIDYVDRGLHELKGFQEPQRLIEVRWQPSAAEAPSGAQEAEIAATIERSIDVLNRVLSITHTDDPGFRPLVECQTKARDLRLRLSRSASVQGQSAQRIQEEIRPFADLVTLLVERDTLEEQRSAQLETAVARSFGWPLVTANARGRLSFGAVEPRAAAPPVAPPPAPAPAPSRTSAPTRTSPPAPTRTPPPAPTRTPPPTPTRTAPPAPTPTRPPSTPTRTPAPTRTPTPPPIPTRAAVPPPVQTPAPAPKETEVPSGPVGLRPPVAPPPTVAVDRRAAGVRWWATAHSAWNEWKSSGIAWAYALRGVLAQHPHLLAVPIRESAEYDEGRLAASYFLLFEHVEHQSSSFVQTAVERAIAQAGGAAAPEALGRALYGLLVADGRLRETYAAFVADAMGTAIPQPGFWADVGIVEHEDATDIVTRAGHGVGDPHEQSRRVTDQKTRSAEWQFAVTPGPLTARFFYVRSGDLKSPRDVEIRVTAGGQPTDHAWYVALKTSLVVRSEPKRIGQKGTALKGLGRDLPGVWVGVFNPDPERPATYEVVLAVRPTGGPARQSSPFAPPGRGR